ncbi:MAG: hypothetical protein EBX47_10635 [Synechococcaceae bacterium WB8_1B_057]|nr:hypothetical protein [Synechococcaceae bacterium WB8_1B_057]
MSSQLSLPPERPVHFIGVGGIGMSALAGILADRGYAVSGSDPRQSDLSQGLRKRGARIFRDQNKATVDAIRSGVSCSPLVVISSAIPVTNPELLAAKAAGLEICHRAALLAWLIAKQRSIAVAGSHGFNRFLAAGSHSEQTGNPHYFDETIHCPPPFLNST